MHRSNRVVKRSRKVTNDELAAVRGGAVAADSDQFAQVRGFKVEIDNAGGKEVDTAWEAVSGGELIIPLTDTRIGGDR